MSREFDGTDDVLTIAAASLLRPSLPVTLCAWVISDDSVTNAIFTNNKVGTTHHGIWIETDSSSLITANYGDNTGTQASDRRSKTGTTALGTGSWHHIGCAIRGVTDASIYLDGVDDGGSYSGTGGALAYNAANGSRIGSSGGTNFWNGLIAEVGFWSVSLTASEIAALAKGMNPQHVRPGSLIGYWPLFGSGSPEPDLTGNVNSAAITGAIAGRHPPVMPFVLPIRIPRLGAGVTAYEDAATVYVDIQPSGVDIGPYEDTATVYVDIAASAVEEFTYSDAGEVYVDIQASGVDIKEQTDAATVYVDIQNTGGECYSTFSAQNFGEGEVTLRWRGTDNLRWSGEDNLRWSGSISVGDSLAC